VAGHTMGNAALCVADVGEGTVSINQAHPAGFASCSHRTPRVI
jgi:hypothetical protein